MLNLLVSLLSISTTDADAPRLDASTIETFDLSRLDVQLARRHQPVRLVFIVDSAGCKVAGCVEVDGLGADGTGGHIIRFARGHDPEPMPKGKPVVIDAYVRIRHEVLGTLWVEGARRVW